MATLCADRGVRAMLSYAGRVAQPRVQPVPTRAGGFGGVAGLAEHLTDQGVTHLVDATHPFAAQISRNAAAAAQIAGVPLIALVRPPWVAGPDDRWQHVADPQAAALALAGPRLRIFLAIGRTGLDVFATAPQHYYLLRHVDPPSAPAPLPDHRVILGRPPFAEIDERELLQEHRIDRVVCKNAGGLAGMAKLSAARALGVPVLMIDRPEMPERAEVDTAPEVLDWIFHAGTDRGV